ncbi:MAG: Ig-like domain-containing protein, partial [Nitrososphaeraceae archaeon]
MKKIISKSLVWMVAIFLTVLLIAPALIYAAGPVTNITVTGAGDATTVANGESLAMSADVLPADADDSSVTWSVAPGTGTATIDATTGVLTGTGVGTVTVTATAND